MASYWGECFPMGGIGGAPFVGKTGFGAFSAHVPDVSWGGGAGRVGMGKAGSQRMGGIAEDGWDRKGWLGSQRMGGIAEDGWDRRGWVESQRMTGIAEDRWDCIG